MSDEYFYGITLTSAKQNVTWDPEEKAEYPRSNKLVLSQALLGHDAKPDEVNVVQVETMSCQDTVKIPIAVLKIGETRHVRLDVEFPDAPVTFTLIQGAGPVYLMGKQMVGALIEEEFEDMEEIEEEMLDEEEGDESQLRDDENKRKASGGKRKGNEEDEEDGGEPKGKKAKISNNAKGKAPSPKKNATKK